MGPQTIRVAWASIARPVVAAAIGDPSLDAPSRCARARAAPTG